MPRLSQKKVDGLVVGYDEGVLRQGSIDAEKTPYLTKGLIALRNIQGCAYDVKFIHTVEAILS